MHDNYTPSYSNSFPETNTSPDLHLAMQAAGVGTWSIVLTEPKQLVWDKRCKELFAADLPSNIAYTELLDLIHNTDRKEVDTAVQKALSETVQGAFEETFRTIDKDGQTFCWVRFIGKVYFDTAGDPQGFTGIALNVTAEKKAAELAAVTQKLAQIAVKGTGVGLFQIALATNEIEYSPAFSKILTGDIIPDLKRTDFINHIHSDDALIRQMAYDEALKTGDLFYESRTIWNDGSVHWIRTVGNYIFDEGGHPTYFSGTIQDITDHKERELALKEAEDRFTAAIKQSESMFRNVTSTAPTGLWMSNPEGKLIYLNRTLVNWTGMPYDELLGHGWAKAVIDEDRPNAAAAFLGAISAQKHYDVEFRINTAWGKVIWCRAAGDPYYSEDGSYAGYVGYCQDINELVETTNHLKVSGERLKAIIEQAPVAIGLLNGREMVIETANDTISKLWGKDQRIIGMKLVEALPELDGQPFMALLEGVYDSGEPFMGYSTRAMLMHGDELKEAYFDFVYTPMRVADGTITGVMVLATEVSVQVFARKAVEESEARFRSVIDEAPFATALYRGRELKIEMANEAMIRVWGKTDKVVGMPLHLALPELQNQSFLQILDDVYTTGVSYHSGDAEVQLEINGVVKSFYFNFTYKPLKNDKGEVYAILNMAVDVTEQVLAGKAIQESELFAQSIIYNSPVAKIVFTGEDMVIKTVNENMLSLLGRDASIIGLPFMEAIPELKQTTLLERLQNVLRTGETYYQPEERIELVKFGVPYIGYFNYIYKVLPNLAGDYYGVIVAATEVTDQVVIREKIMEAEEALRGAIELAELATWSIDLSTGERNYSTRLRQWFGFDDTQEIPVEQVYTIISPKDHAAINKAMHHATDPEIRGPFDVEYTLISVVTGSERIVHSIGKAFFDEHGRAYKISGTAQDVTRERKIQAALEAEVKKRTEQLQSVNEELSATNEELSELNELLLHSNEELAQYAYVASHDLQEPLRKIRIFSDMLDKQSSQSPDSKKLVMKISQSAARMSLLIQDLLEFSKLLKSETLMQPIELSTVVEAVVNDFELSIEEKGADVKIGTLPEIEAVGLQMNQLFYNLFSNAIKFSRPGIKPLIHISSEKLSGEDVKQFIPRPIENTKYYKIVVADNGIGFDSNYAEQIFEVFKRLHVRDSYPGSGIGLALCRRIVTNHKGYMYAKSEPNKGSTFYVILPAANS